MKSLERWAGLFGLVLCLTIGTGKGLLAQSAVVGYRIAGLRVEGLRHTDKDLLLMIAGLKEGQRFTMSGEEGAKAVRNLWAQGLFGDIRLRVDSMVGQDLYLCLVLEEKPRLSRVVFNRKVSKARAEEISESLKSFKGKILTDEVQGNIERVVRKYYRDKGYLDVKTTLQVTPDSTQINTSILNVTVVPGSKVRVGALEIQGNQVLSYRAVARILKAARPRVSWNPFRTGKWDPEKFDEQKLKLIGKYQELGYRDARILLDSLYQVAPGRMGIHLVLTEGKPYYIRSLELEGNTVHPDSLLRSLIGIKAGDLYNKSLLESKL